MAIYDSKASKAKNPDAAFKAYPQTPSTSLVESLAQGRSHDALSRRKRRQTVYPIFGEDLIFAFGYKLVTGDVEIDDTAQGSGVQSLLMFQTLSLIDRDYFRKIRLETSCGLGGGRTGSVH